MTVTEMRELLYKQGLIALLWSVEDVTGLVEEMKGEGVIPQDITITNDEAMEILQDVERRHDASLGVTWDTLRYGIENFITGKQIGDNG